MKKHRRPVLLCNLFLVFLGITSPEETEEMSRVLLCHLGTQTDPVSHITQGAACPKKEYFTTSRDPQDGTPPPPVVNMLGRWRFWEAAAKHCMHSTRRGTVVSEGTH